MHFLAPFANLFLVVSQVFQPSQVPSHRGGSVDGLKNSQLKLTLNFGCSVTGGFGGYKQELPKSFAAKEVSESLLNAFFDEDYIEMLRKGFPQVIDTLKGKHLPFETYLEHLRYLIMRTLTIGFLTPFYFIRAGAFVSIPALVAAPVIFFVLLGGKVLSKIFGLYPVIGKFRAHKKERWYYTLLMSTGLTFGTISAIYGLTHNIVTESQYSILVAVVIGSALIPTMIANAWFLPRHLLKIHPPVAEEEEMPEIAIP